MKAKLSAFLDRRPARAAARGYGVITATRIYLLPTKQGCIFIALLIVMFVGSVNYSNNLGYFLTFFLASVAVTSMVHAHRNMVGLMVRSGGARPVFAGQPARFKLLVRPATAHCRRAVRVEALDRLSASQTVGSDQDTEFFIESPNTERGTLRLGRVAISSRYPLGLVRAWAWFELDVCCLVYPSPHGDRRLPDDHGASQAGPVGYRGEQENYSGLRDYRPGDPLRRIAWKASARSQAIYTKLFDSDGRRGLVLRWQDAGAGDDEARLSQLCLWTLLSDQDGREYGLVLPGRTVPPGSGERHRGQCLEALARHGR